MNYYCIFIDLECGLPAQVPNGQYTLINGTRGYQSTVRYECEEGHVMVGRNDLMCDIDQKWNGPPPRCETLVCPEPPQILNGYYEIVAQTENSYQVTYDCSPGFSMIGPYTLTCSEGAYDQPPPVCRETMDVARVPIVPVPVVTRPPPTQPPTPPPTTTKRVPVIQTTTPVLPEEKYEEDNHYDDSIYTLGEENNVGQGQGQPQDHDHGDHEEDHKQPEEEKKPVPPPVVPVVPVVPVKPPSVRPNLDVNNGLDNDPVLNNEGAESINVNIIHKGKTNADEPKNSIEIQSKASAVSRLNLGIKIIHSFN